MKIRKFLVMLLISILLCTIPATISRASDNKKTILELLLEKINIINIEETDVIEEKEKIINWSIDSIIPEDTIAGSVKLGYIITNIPDGYYIDEKSYTYIKDFEEKFEIITIKKQEGNDITIEGNISLENKEMSVIIKTLEDINLDEVELIAKCCYKDSEGKKKSIKLEEIRIETENEGIVNSKTTEVEIENKYEEDNKFNNKEIIKEENNSIKNKPITLRTTNNEITLDEQIGEIEEISESNEVKETNKNNDRTNAILASTLDNEDDVDEDDIEDEEDEDEEATQNQTVVEE